MQDDRNTGIMWFAWQSFTTEGLLLDSSRQQHDETLLDISTPEIDMQYCQHYHIQDYFHYYMHLLNADFVETSTFVALANSDVAVRTLWAMEHFRIFRCFLWKDIHDLDSKWEHYDLETAPPPVQDDLDDLFVGPTKPEDVKVELAAGTTLTQAVNQLFGRRSGRLAQYQYMIGEAGSMFFYMTLHVHTSNLTIDMLRSFELKAIRFHPVEGGSADMHSSSSIRYNLIAMVRCRSEIDDGDFVRTYDKDGDNIPRDGNAADLGDYASAEWKVEDLLWGTTLFLLYIRDSTSQIHETRTESVAFTEFLDFEDAVRESVANDEKNRARARG